MIPKEKAQELANKYYWLFGDGYLGDWHIKCALMAVDEILNVLYFNNELTEEDLLHRNYWIQVKEELFNLQKL